MRNKIVTIIALTVNIDSSDNRLNYSQYHNVIENLISEGYNIEELPKMKLFEIYEIKGIKKEEAESIYSALKNYKKAVEFYIKLTELNIGILCEDDDFYPIRLKETLKKEAPPLLFYYGDCSLFNNECVSTTGSRKVGMRGKKIAQDIGITAAKENKTLVTGGANGVDSIASLETLKSGGAVIWYIATSFVKALDNATIKKCADKGHLLLASNDNPLIGFSSKKALSRNKYIYASSEISFVCECISKISGTFSGASNCLKNHLSTLYVFDTGSAGSTELINNGANSVEIS